MMKLKKVQSFFVILLLAALPVTFFSFKSPVQHTMVNDKVIKRSDGTLYQKGIINIKFKQQVDNFTELNLGVERLDNSLAEYNVTNVSQRFPLNANRSNRKIGDEDLAKVFTINYKGNIDPFELSEQIMSQNADLLEWAEPDFVYESDYTPNDPNIAGQWHIAKIKSFQAWDITKGDTNVVIGIVDSGSDLDHPDLQANIWKNLDEIPGNNIDDDANGYIDDWIGWDFIGSGSGMDNDPQVYGSNCDHGSHVSGCASQVTDNNTGGAGIGFKCKLMISKHGDDDDFSGAGGSSLIYNSDQGMVYCYQNGAKVINCSFSSPSFSSLQQNVINNAWANGTIVVGSAGNQSVNQPRYPAACNNTISVAASNSNDIKAGFSNWHATVDITGPGDAIMSTLWNNIYASLSGTSMSAPITSGTIALLWSKNPSWTQQQIVDRLLLGVDSIYNIPGNAPYAGGLGTGRVNALKSLSDTPILEISNVSPSDSIYGNNDGIFDINEEVSLKMSIKNTWLAGNNVSIRIATSDPNIEIVSDSVYLGNIGAYATQTVDHNVAFRVKAKVNCPFDHSASFQISSNQAYVDNVTGTFNVSFRQGFAVHDANAMKLALTKDGAIGKKPEAYGSGLMIGASPTNHIYESGLMIGISNTQVSDMTRREQAPANVADTDFVAINAYTLNQGGLSSQDGSGLFNDNGAGASKIGVTVDAGSYVFSSNYQDSSSVILRYKITNNNASPINNMFVGIMSAYQPNGSFNTNVSNYDATTKMGYTYNNASSNLYLGTALLSDQTPGFKAFSMVDMFNGFTPQEKWDALSNGIVNTTLGPSPNCYVISAGPINLAAGESTIIGFAIVKGNDLNDLIANRNAAHSHWASVGINQVSQTIPENYELMQNYPNPFNPATKITFALPKKDFVKLSVYDILGRQVASLVNEELNAGTFEYNFNGAALSSGMYFYRLETPGFVQTRKMLLVK
jgi:serine protease